jgi:EAL domain-containing protein (putative c-di-GMP-specific phosphodiesterase class I)
MPCTRCEALPPIATHGTLYLAPPLQHTAGTVRSAIIESGLLFEEPGPGLLAVRPETPTALGRLLANLGHRLSTIELRDTKCLLLADGTGTPTILQLLRMETLAGLVARFEGRWLIDLLREERIVSHFQPIVSANAPQQVYAYEMLLRGIDEQGQLVFPGRIFSVARAADLLFQVDRAARVSAIRQAHRHSVDAHLFINFVPTAIYDPEFCLRSTVHEIEKAGISAERVVFEVVESEQVHDVAHLGRIMHFYRERGFRLALDDVGAGYSSLTLLPELRPDFIKLDMGLVHGVDRDPYRATIAAKLLELAQSLGVRTVAEGVETRGEYDWLVEHGADLVQGWLFARPGSPPPQPAALG